MKFEFMQLFPFGRKRGDTFLRLSRDLLEFSSSFSSITDMGQLIPSVIGKVRDLVGVREAALFLLDSATQRYILTHSRDVELKPHLRLRGDYYFTPDDKLVRWLLNNRMPFVMSTMREVFNFFEEEERDVLRFIAAETVVPLEAHHRLIGILSLGPRAEGRQYASEELQFLSVIAAQAALAFENSRMQQEEIERMRMKRELEIAGELQQSLLPSSPPKQYDSLDIAGFCVPCNEVGGDYFDFLPLDERELGIVIGDVAGHGMRAGLLMGMAKACISTAVRLDSSCPAVMRSLNYMIHALSERRVMMTLIYFLLNVAERTLIFSNAGHIYPYVYRSSSDRLTSIESTSYPLGIRPEYPFPVMRSELEPGDFVLCCSDGLVEAATRKGEQFGFGRLEEAIFRHRESDAYGLCVGIRNDLRKFLSGANHQDDVTLLAFRMKG